MRLIGLVLATVFAIGATLAHAAGLELIEVPSGAEGRTLTGVVWYPCAAPAQPVKLSELLVVSAVKDCPIEGNAWPLVVISHGRTGNFFLHRDIAGVLADAGFAVAAIYHPGDSSRDMSRTNDLSVLIERPADITRLVDFMLNTWAGARALDRERIGFFGFSRGGYTGLVEMGANPDFSKRLSSPIRR